MFFPNVLITPISRKFTASRTRPIVISFSVLTIKQNNMSYALNRPRNIVEQNWNNYIIQMLAWQLGWLWLIHSECCHANAKVVCHLKAFGFCFVFFCAHCSVLCLIKKNKHTINQSPANSSTAFSFCVCVNTVRNFYIRNTFLTQLQCIK